MEKRNVVGSRPAAEWTDPDDAPELTEEFFKDAETFQGDTFVRRGRGRPPTGNAKELISVRLDQDVLAKLRTAGPGWQSQVNAILRAGLKLDRRDAHHTHPGKLAAFGKAAGSVTKGAEASKPDTRARKRPSKQPQARLP